MKREDGMREQDDPWQGEEATAIRETAEIEIVVHVAVRE
jgi:hypothetical protein